MVRFRGSQVSLGETEARSAGARGPVDARCGWRRSGREGQRAGATTSSARRPPSSVPRCAHRGRAAVAASSRSCLKKGILSTRQPSQTRGAMESSMGRRLATGAHGLVVLRAQVAQATGRLLPPWRAPKRRHLVLPRCERASAALACKSRPSMADWRCSSTARWRCASGNNCQTGVTESSHRETHGVARAATAAQNNARRQTQLPRFPHGPSVSRPRAM